MVLGIAAFGLLVGCAAAESPGSEGPSGTGGSSSGTGGKPSSSGTGGSSSSGGSTGSTGTGGSTSEPGTGGSTGTGGSMSTATGGSSGGGEDASAPGTGGGSGATDAGSTPETSTPPTPSNPNAPMDFGGVGEQPLVPLYYSDQPVPPIVAMDCPEDPTAGWTEYKDSFVVQRPRNLAGKDRFKFENGIYTSWIMPGDQPHKANNNTKPRTETRFSDIGTGEHMMSLDVMVEPGSSGTVIHQFKSAGTKGGNIGTYIEMAGGTMRDRAGTVATGVSGKWVNLKIAFNIPTGQGKIYLNNCLKVNTSKEKNALWYFKFGNYHCDGASKCSANFKNIHLYHKGSTDKFNVKSPIP
jgi:hypothetical protein